MKTILHSHAYCLDYLRDQVADVAPSDMVAQPRSIANHPAWVLGHLTLSCQALGGELGLAEWLPAKWSDRFGTGSTPVADADQYESKSEALEILGDAQVRITAAIVRLTADELDRPLPDEASRVILPTVRQAITQVLVAHPAHHAGQLTVWRRAMGLPSLGRPFL